MLDASLQSRIAAYQDPESDVPAIWTPEHVSARMVEAFEVLARLPERVGPAGPHNAWPAIWHEYKLGELVGVELKNTKPKIGATAAELSRMNEAFAWPLQYLTGEPIMADALSLWAFCKANDRDIRDLLRNRMQRALAALKEMQGKENVRIQELRSVLARSVATWANAKMFQSDGSAQSIANIKANARIRFQRAVDENCLYPVQYRPQDAMPGKILTRSTMDRQRKAATAMLADKLQSDGIVVR